METAEVEVVELPLPYDDVGVSEQRIKKIKGPTGRRTQVAGFKDQSANHYTIEPALAHASLEL